MAAFYPEVVKELDELIENHLAEIDSQKPVINQEYDPKADSPIKDNILMRSSQVIK
jgi:hypothetical protein